MVMTSSCLSDRPAAPASARLWSSASPLGLGLRVNEPGAAESARLVWSVSALLLAAGDALATRFGACTVRGELAGFTRASSGHSYFTLKDAEGGAAALRCALFRRAGTLLDFAPRDGQRVVLRGRVAVFEPRGELQFVVEAMQLAGAGALFEEVLRLKARLEAQGLFDAARKRALPRFPRRIGVVTSLGAAALHDIVSALARRAPQVAIVVYPSRVQGAEAPLELVEALARAARRGECDLLILARGGGSLEDLWAFNDERVVRAVAASPLPVVCGVGHETDVTLADLAADMRAPTPTAAAEMAAPVAAELLAVLHAMAGALSRSTERVLLARAQRLDRLLPSLGQPRLRLAAQARRLDRLDSRLAAAAVRLRHARGDALNSLARALIQAVHKESAAQRQRVATLDARLFNLNPQRVLERGFSVLQTATGELLVDPRRLAPGQDVRVAMALGSAEVTLARVRPAST